MEQSYQDKKDLDHFANMCLQRVLVPEGGCLVQRRDISKLKTLKERGGSVTINMEIQLLLNKLTRQRKIIHQNFMIIWVKLAHEVHCYYYCTQVKLVDAKDWIIVKITLWNADFNINLEEYNDNH